MADDDKDPKDDAAVMSKGEQKLAADARASGDDDETANAAAAKAAIAEAPTVRDIRWKIFAIVGVLSLVADQATKIWARAVLPVLGRDCSIPYDLIPASSGMRPKCDGGIVSFIDGFWEWKLSMNTGSAFGLFGSNPAAARVFLSVVGVLAVGGMIYMLRKCRPDQRILQWALAFVAGGAIGNLIDRMYFGAVTDMVLWRYKTTTWPVFNVADVVLVVGVGLMFIDIQKEGKKEKAAKKARAVARKKKIKAAGLVKHE